jgi:hypothetical protein
MNFQQVINQRKFLTPYQEQSLITILGNGQSKEKKYKLKMLVQNKFYSIFDQHQFANRFFIYDAGVEHGLKDDELKQFRVDLIKLYDEE